MIARGEGPSRVAAQGDQHLWKAFCRAMSREDRAKADVILNDEHHPVAGRMLAVVADPDGGNHRSRSPGTAVDHRFRGRVAAAGERRRPLAGGAGARLSMSRLD